jgi:hypothetical protein
MDSQIFDIKNRSLAAYIMKLAKEHKIIEKDSDFLRESLRNIDKYELPNIHYLASYYIIKTIHDHN